MTIAWHELVILMGFGDGREDRISGTVRIREVEPVADIEVRVARRGDLVRLCAPDGRVTAIFGAQTSWFFNGGDDVPFAYPRSGWHFGGGEVEFVRRRVPSRWEGDDFTKLTGPIVDTEYLGRPAFAFELAPPERKPHPVQMIVDAETGIVLREANADFGSYTEWLDIDFDADLPDDRFTWSGPTRSPEDRHTEHAAEMAERQAWLDAHGLVLELPVQPAVRLHERDDETGAFELSFHTTANGSLIRRPHDDPAPDAAIRYPHLHRWTDSRWAWLLGTTEPVAEEQLALLKVQLGKST